MISFTFNKDDAVAAMHTGVVKVSFTKVNGDKRVMDCTLKEGVIPAATKDDPLSTKKIRALNEAVCCVWDVNSQGWRSFRWESVTGITIL